METGTHLFDANLKIQIYDSEIIYIYRSYREICRKCGKECLRGFDVTDDQYDWRTHITVRLCDNCWGPLRDMIVNFSERTLFIISVSLDLFKVKIDVPKRETELAVSNSRKADLVLVLGTSMNVQCAASYPVLALPNGGKVLILMD
jgi:NAD-dependent SIR2 family protein deacetylase